MDDEGLWFDADVIEDILKDRWLPLALGDCVQRVG